MFEVYRHGNGTNYSNGEKENSVIVVDDNPDVTDVIADLGAACGKDVRKYGSGEEALMAFYQGPTPGLLISDLSMPPGIDGLILCDEVRKKFPETFRVLLTGNLFDEERLREAVEDGTIHAYIFKPCPSGSLTELLGGFKPASPMELSVPIDDYINR